MYVNQFFQPRCIKTFISFLFVFRRKLFPLTKKGENKKVRRDLSFHLPRRRKEKRRISEIKKIYHFFCCFFFTFFFLSFINMKGASFSLLLYLVVARLVVRVRLRRLPFAIEIYFIIPHIRTMCVCLCTETTHTHKRKRCLLGEEFKCRNKREVTLIENRLSDETCITQRRDSSLLVTNNNNIIIMCLATYLNATFAIWIRLSI